MAKKPIEEILGHVTQFGRLTVLGEGEGYLALARGKERLFRTVLCRCQCGTERDFQAHKLRSGQTVSCGCHAAQRASEGNRTHGMTRSPEYISWASMIQRCENPKATGYELYGGSGVKVCARWRESFEAFYEDMGPRPPRMTLDRVERGGNYEPSNVRWASAKVQTNNRSNMRHINTRKGQMNFSDAAREFGVSRQTIRKRLRQGMSPEQAVGIEPKPYGRKPIRIIEFRGESLGLSAMAAKFGLSQALLSYRLKNGWTIERALTETPRKRS